MDIYIGKDGQVLGPYRDEEIRARLEDGCFDGTELACREGLDEWVNVKKLLEEKAPEPEETEEPEPLMSPQEQINKIKELIGLGHADTAWQLIQSLNDPRINEGLLEDCPGNDWWRSNVPEYLSENADLFIKLLVNPPQSGWLRPELTQFKSLDLSHSEVRVREDGSFGTLYRIPTNRLTSVKGLEKLTQLTSLNLEYNKLTELPKGLEDLTQLTELELFGNPALTKVQIDELQKALPNCGIISNTKK